MSRISLVLRSLFLIAFVIAMPLLALPSVAKRLDEFLYGQPEATVPTETWQAADQGIDDVMHATFDSPLKSSIDAPNRLPASQGLDGRSGDAPVLAPVPHFPEPSAPLDDSSAAPIDLPPIGAFQGGTQPKIEAIRQRLEDLGADHVLLEEVELGGKFRFVARMLVAAGSDETRNFEATANDPAAAAEEVLQAVLSWRGLLAPAHVE